MRPNAKVLELRERALSAIRSVARIGPHFKPTALEIEADGTATIQAEVDNIAIKRLALERLAATKGITAIVDRLRVKPAVQRIVVLTAAARVERPARHRGPGTVVRQPENNGVARPAVGAVQQRVAMPPIPRIQKLREAIRAKRQIRRDIG